MKIGIVTAAWQRPELLTLWCWYWSSLRTQLLPSIELKIYCACSELQATQICQKHGIEVVGVANDPLYAKWNTITQLARKDRPDFCIFLGSDDLINATGIKNLAERMMAPAQRPDYCATLDWWFWDTGSRRMAYWGGYRETYRAGEPCGAGRALSARLLDLIDWSPWIPGYDKVLDTGFTKQLAKHTLVRDFFMASSVKGFMGLDIKTEVNMTPFRLWDNTSVIVDGLLFIAKHFDSGVTDKLIALPEYKERVVVLPPVKMKSHLRKELLRKARNSRR